MLSFWKKYKSLILNIALPLAVGLVSGLLTMGAMEDFSSLNQPPLSPPGWLFPVVWTILYALMGVSSWRIRRIDRQAPSLTAYMVSLVFNFFWSIIFFDFEWYIVAFIWLIVLWVLILVTAILFYKLSKTAGYLMLPYLIWVTFAGYLNFSIYLLN